VLVVVLAGCLQDELVVCGDLLCPAGSTCNPNGTCNNPFLPDEDRDGVPDASDNCRAVANSPQLDLDRDGIGDLCDNCPLYENTEQRDVGDEDGVGDNCDPHPSQRGDCYEVIDTFSNPDAFAAHWDILAAPTTPVATQPGMNEVIVSVGAGGAAFGVVDSNGQNVQGVFDVQIRAAGDLPSGTLSVATSTTATQHMACALSRSTIAASYQYGTMNDLQARPLLAAPIGNEIIMWLSPPDGTRDLLCRVLHGNALGVASTVLSQRYTGAVGFTLRDDTVTLRGFAAISWNAGATCNPPLFR
jgi:hypothetical protein